MQTTKTCEQCGSQYIAEAWRQNVRRFCSQPCSSAFKSKKVEVKCEQCGTIKQMNPDRAKNRRYCSRKCQVEAARAAGEAARIVCVCERCGMPKRMKPSEVAAFRFCSKACRIAWDKTMRGELNPLWTPRVKVTCRHCGSAIASTRKFCGKACAGKYSSLNRFGENHPLWQGGYKLRKEQMQKWRDANREKLRALNFRRRVLRDMLLEEIDYESIIKRDGGVCYLCGRAPEMGKLTIDHVVPLARGGAHTRNNLRVACRSCNCRKGKKLLEEFICFLEPPPATAQDSRPCRRVPSVSANSPSILPM